MVQSVLEVAAMRPNNSSERAIPGSVVRSPNANFTKRTFTRACADNCRPRVAQVEEVVVTGARISGDDYSAIPAVVLQRRGDFLVQRIRLTNDTRAQDARIKELQQTISDMVRDAAKKPGVA